ncbi:hypothetical protein [Streptomyces syringium]|uniref:hypothetical protein n=1 Tax=Streptomyces syringium TaxID=76729 RepID=UPI003451D814
MATLGYHSPADEHLGQPAQTALTERERHLLVQQVMSSQQHLAGKHLPFIGTAQHPQDCSQVGHPLALSVRGPAAA